MSKWFSCLVLVLLSLTMGCGSSDSFATAPVGDSRAAVPPISNLMGRVEGTSFLVGVSADTKRVLVYLCDGVLAQRFDGDLTNGHADLTSATGDQLSITVDGGTATGTVVLAGSTRSFTAQRSPAGSGLFWASGQIEGQSLVGGWILYEKNKVGVVSRPSSFSLNTPVAQPVSSIIAILIGLRLPVVGPATTAGGPPVLGVVSSDTYKELR